LRCSARNANGRVATRPLAPIVGSQVPCIKNRVRLRCSARNANGRGATRPLAPIVGSQVPEPLRVLGEHDRGRLFIVARMVAGTTWFVCKAGTTKMTKTSTKVAGIDTGKAMLEIGTYPAGDSLQVANAGDGHKQLVAWLR